MVAHHTLFCHLLSINFQNCEVVEMRLRQTSSLEQPRVWEVLSSTGPIVPAYAADGTPMSWAGSPPLKCSIGTCLKVSGLEAAQLTANKAGLPDPATHPPPSLP